MLWPLFPIPGMALGLHGMFSPPMRLLLGMNCRAPLMHRDGRRGESRSLLALHPKVQDHCLQRKHPCPSSPQVIAQTRPLPPLPCCCCCCCAHQVAPQDQNGVGLQREVEVSCPTCPPPTTESSFCVLGNVTQANARPWGEGGVAPPLLWDGAKERPLVGHCVGNCSSEHPWLGVSKDAAV